MANSEERSEAEREEQGGEIKVTDRRLFHTDGQLRQEIEDDEPSDAAPPPGGGETRPAEEAPAGSPDADSAGAGKFEHRPIEEPEGVDFTMLLNAMVQPALIFLGEIPHPGTGKGEVNLEQAQLQIDLLDLLRVKCRGNLSPNEDGLLDRMLYQLRMLYVARSGQGRPGPPAP